MDELVRYIEGLDKKSIKELVYSLNKIIDVENTASLTELAKQPFKILRRFNSLPKENRKILKKAPAEILISNLKTKIKKTTK